jgi:hypothetical protein
MPTTVMTSYAGPCYSLAIIEIPPLASANIRANVRETSGSWSSRSSRFESRRSNIDGGKSARRVAVGGGEQHKASVAAHGACMLLTHQRLQDDGVFLDLAT